MKAHYLAWALGSTLVLGIGCGSDGGKSTSKYPYDPDQVVVIGGDSEEPLETPDGKGCLEIDNENCIQPQEECGDDGTADLILDEKGNVVDVICYPTSGAPIETIPAEAVPVNKTQNNAVVVLDGADDGVDIEGDLSVDANNVVIYGESPEVSVIGGDLDITKNNTTVRGVRITGDLTVEFNNANFVFCVIEGDVTIIGNNTTIAGCDIWGSLTIQGENTILVSNHLADPGPFSAQGLVCNANYYFEDSDKDGVIDAEELDEDPISCSDKSG